MHGAYSSHQLEDREMTTTNKPSLHEALAGFGITSKKDERSDFNSRSLYQNGLFIGAYTAFEAWELVNDLRYGVEERPAA
jgi:hypothetical protein